MKILACPVCKHHPLELAVEREEVQEIIEGRLSCSKCQASYLIEDGIPNLLPPD